MTRASPSPGGGLYSGGAPPAQVIVQGGSARIGTAAVGSRTLIGSGIASITGNPPAAPTTIIGAMPKTTYTAPSIPVLPASPAIATQPNPNAGRVNTPGYTIAG